MPNLTAQVTLRMPKAVHLRVRKSAEQNHRSLNSEIVHVLDRVLASDEMKCPATAATVPGSDHPQTLGEKADEQIIA